MKSLLTMIFLLAGFYSFSQNPEWITYNMSNSGLPSNDISSIAIDPSGTKWIGTYSRGLVKFKDTTWTIYNISNSGLPNDSITSITSETNGNIWIGTFRGLAKLEDTTWTIYNTFNSGLPNDSITSIASEANGNIWIGTYRGLAKLENTTWTIYNTSNSSLPNNKVTPIAIDPSGDKWIGPFLTKFNNTTWTSYQLENSPCSGISSIAVDPNGIKWIGVDCDIFGGGLFRFDGVNSTKYSLGNSGLEYDDVRVIAIESNGTKWLGSRKVTSSNQNFYYWGGGLTKFDGTNWTSYFTNNSGLPNDFVTSIAIDALGNKWLTSTGSGLTVFREGGVILGVEKNTLQANDFIIYPNPARDKIMISNNLKSIKKASIFNFLGSKVMETEGMGMEIQMDISGLLDGIYIVQVQTEKGFETKRLVINR